MARNIMATAALAMFFTALTAGSGEPGLARAIMRETGIGGGLCVHLGCDDGVLAVEFAQTGKFLVHGWCTDATALAKARGAIQAKGVYGQASVERGSLDRLPYANSLVNLVVVDDLAAALKQGLRLTDVMRVLAPRGVAYLGQRPGSGGLSAAQLRSHLASAGIKEVEIVERTGTWAKIVKPLLAGADDWTHYNYDPTGNRVSHDAWAGPPSRVRWLDGPSWPTDRNGPSAAVTAGGRLFYVADQAPDGKPPRHWLFARDAHNGLLIWKKPSPVFAPQALIATPDKLFTVVEHKGPLAALDAATGQVLTVYKQGGNPDWAIHHQDKLLISSLKRLKCLDAATGQLVWQSNRSLPAGGMSTNLTVGGKELYFVDAGQRQVGCMDFATGAEKWSRPMAAGLSDPMVEVGLCAQGKGVLIVGESGKRSHGKGIHAFSSQDGKHLWSRQYDLLRSGRPARVKAASYLEVFLIDGLFWVLVGDPEKRQGDSWQGLDPLTGVVQARCDFPPEVRIAESCQRARATERFLLGGHADFVDVKARKYAERAEGVHGGCGFGMLPGNGLMYTWSRYTSTYLRGELGLEAGTALTPHQEDGARLEKGPAEAGGQIVAAADDWPCYRHDPARSGQASTTIPAQPAKLWEVTLGGRLSPPTVATGMVFVTAVDDHRVLALDAGTGKARWSFTAGGRVPIRPTYDQGLCLFGCADGWVYCLRADDGQFVWRFRAAPRERRIVAHGQLESPWPVAGGVLVVDGLAYFAAGRHGSLDDGVHVYAADPLTGKIVWTKQHHEDPVLRLLLSDGKAIRMSGKAGFALKTGDAASGLLGSPSAYDPNELSLTHILVAKEKTDAARINADVRTLLRSGQTIWAAGWPAASAPEIKRGGLDRPIDHFPDENPDPKHCQLWAFAAGDGKQLHGLNIGVAPVFDGMAAARGRLYLTTQDGKVVCYGRE